MILIYMQIVLGWTAGYSFSDVAATGKRRCTLVIKNRSFIALTKHSEVILVRR